MEELRFSQWVAEVLDPLDIQDVQGNELLVCIDGEGVPRGITQAAVRSGGQIVALTDNTNISTTYPSGTVFTDAGSSGTVTVTFADSPLNTEYTFFVTDNAIELYPGNEIGHTIQFWDGSNSRDTVLVLLGDPGKSITIKKITATKWAAIAVNGAVDND